jgi:Na+/H+ antiporter NhaD/arsenite permease-like protein
MREAAVFAYIVAVFVFLAVVVYTMISVSSGHDNWWLPVLAAGFMAFTGLWSMAHWMIKHD